MEGGMRSEALYWVQWYVDPDINNMPITQSTESLKPSPLMYDTYTLNNIVTNSFFSGFVEFLLMCDHVCNDIPRS